MAAVEDSLEVGCLHVGLIAVRNIKPAKQGGMGDFFGLTPQHKPYCKITLGGHEFTSGVGVRTTAGHAWNREQMVFPVKVPLSCVVGVSGDEQQWWNKTPTPGSRTMRGRGLNQGAEKACAAVGGGLSLKGCGSTGRRGKGGGAGAATGGGGGVACGSSLSRAAAAADAAAAHEVWGRLTLRAQVLHREDNSAASKETRRTTEAASERPETRKSSGSSSTTITTTTTATKATKTRASSDVDTDIDDGGGRLLGECSLNLVEVVSGRAPHIDEWIPLGSGGDLRLSLDYDSIVRTPAPGDSVVLLCLSNRLDFFPLPVWDTTADPGRPGSASWLWARDASQRRLLGPGGGGGGGGGGGFRVEEAGDDFFLISYATPEGWRCAVEVHRFLVYPDPTAPQRWTLSELRNRAIATPAAAAVRRAVLRASQEETLWAGGKELVHDVAKGVSGTAGRWWGGGLERVRSDVLFALGLTDTAESTKSGGSERSDGAEEEDRAGEEDGDRDLIETDTESRHRQQQQLPSTTPATGVCGLAEDGASSNPAFPVGTEASSSCSASDRLGVGGLRSADSTTPQEPAAAAAASPSRMERKTVAAVITAPSGVSQSPQRPQHLCPITRCPMEDPAVAADGYTYERTAIERWLSEHDTSPVTGQVLETKVVFKNWSLVASAATSTSRVTATQRATPGT